ncbi:unnamed protein product [Knipowitschia caucasica]
MGPLQPLSLVCWLLLAATAQMNGPWVNSSFLSATAGDNVTLRCFSDKNAGLGANLYWYKQSLGKKPTVISSFFLYDKRVDKKTQIHEGFGTGDRFTVENNDSVYNLHIQSVRVNDSALYHCVRCFLHHNVFLESILVVVQSSKLTAEVLQTQLVDIDRGESVSLNCSVQTGSCNEAHSVHWFKKSEESTAGVLYSRGNSSDQCEKSMDSPTNSCFYNLHIHNVNSEQTGTYYCAVAACGQVLFGNGTRLRIRELKSRMLSMTNREEQDEDSLHYAALNVQSSSRRQRVTAQTDCVYSGVHL